MPKSAKKRSPKSTAAPTTAAKSPQPAITAPESATSKPSPAHASGEGSQLTGAGLTTHRHRSRGGSRIILRRLVSEQFRPAPRTCLQVCGRLSLRPIEQLGRRPGGWTMPTSEDYRQMANRSAQLAIGCSAPSIAQALLALGLEYMALAARLGEPAAMRQDPAGFGD